MKFTRSQQLGILALCVIIFVLQIIIFSNGWFQDSSISLKDKNAQEWLALQKQVDLLKKTKSYKKDTIYPFNPNFISDYKGYQLGMSVAEIDRLHQFRAQNKWVNSVEDFQQVTQVSDSLLQKIAPFFKFPDWVKNKNKSGFSNSSMIVQIDINQASQQDLMDISGIGEVLSERILQQKEQLGGFISTEQLGWVFGITPEVFKRLQQKFVVKQKPAVLKLKINEANLKELTAFPYFNYELAKNIMTFRTMQGNEIRPEDLLKIKNFPTEKVHTITLYLQF